MSAPRTNIERQKSHHKAPLMGMGGVVALALLLLAVFLGWLALNGNDPQGAEVQLDSRTGELVEN